MVARDPAPLVAFRAVVLLAVAVLLLLLGTTLWLLRDPRPWFNERRLGLTLVVEGPTERSGGVLSRHVRLEDTSGLAVDLVVRTPDAAASGQPGVAAHDAVEGRPLFLILGGYRTGERAAMLIEDTQGSVVASMGYPYDGPIDARGFALVTHLPAIRRAVLDTPPAVRLALDHLLSLPEVDARYVELVGVSFGAFFAPVAAALDQRVTRLWLVHGSARPYEVLEHALEASIPYSLPRALVATAANVVLAGPSLAPELWVRRVAPRPVVMINASDDERLPRSAVEALYARARSPKEQIWLSGQHVHPNRPDMIGEIMEVLLSRAGEQSLRRE